MKTSGMNHRYSTYDKIQDYRIQHKEHAQRMSDTRLPKAVGNYTSKGRRNLGRPRKMYLTNESETGT